MKSIFDYIKKHKLLLLIILPAFFLYMLVIFPSGTFFCFKDACGINFWGVHGHDGIWHLAIANVAFSKFPFIAPTYAGENLYGYNYLLDFFIFLLSKIGIPSIVSYFKILPVVWFTVFTGLLIVLGRKIKDNAIFVSLFLFFTYFAGSFYYLIKLYWEGTINDSSTQLPQPVMITMSNPPFAFSLLFLLGILILLKDGKINFKKIIFISIGLFFLLGLKFYSIVTVFLVATYIIIDFLNTTIFNQKKNKINSWLQVKKYISYLCVVAFFVLLALLFFYDPLRSVRSGSVFGFAPFALVHTITETPNMFYLRNMTDARYYLMEHGIGPRLIGIEMLNLLIWLFFYLGTRFFGLIYAIILIIKAKMDRFDLSVMLTICFSTFLSLILVQKAEWWNTIQFFYYAIFLLTIYLAKMTFEFMHSKKIFLKLVAIIIMLLSLPTTFDMTKFFSGVPGATYIAKDEIKALAFLKKQPEGVVLTPLYTKNWKNYAKENEIYSYEDTAYVTAFSDKQSYLTDILQLRLTGVPFESRLKRLQNMDCSILDEVNYVYELRRLEDKEKIIVKCKPKNFRKIYNNSKIFIYAKNK